MIQGLLFLWGNFTFLPRVCLVHSPNIWKLFSLNLTTLLLTDCTAWLRALGCGCQQLLLIRRARLSQLERDPVITGHIHAPGRTSILSMLLLTWGVCRSNGAVVAVLLSGGWLKCPLTSGGYYAYYGCGGYLHIMTLEGLEGSCCWWLFNLLHNWAALGVMVWKWKMILHLV